MSAITPRSIELVQIVNSLQVAHQSSGSAIAADQMPASLLDAIRICEYESKSIESAMDDALYQ